MSNINDMGYEVRSQFMTIDEGSYDAVVHAIIGLGLNRSFFKDQEKAPAVNVKIIYEVPDLLRDDGETVVIGQRLKLSTHEKSRCYDVITTMLNKKLTPSEMLNAISSEGLKNLLGKQVVITVNHWIKEDRAIPVVNEVGKLDPRLAATATKASRDTFFFNPLSPDIDVFKNNLTFNTQQQIMAALNSDQFPKEIQEAWVTIQENKVAKDNQSNGMSGNSYNTDAIE